MEGVVKFTLRLPLFLNKEPLGHSIGGWVGPKTVLDVSGNKKLGSSSNWTDSPLRHWQQQSILFTKHVYHNYGMGANHTY
jgi:hypothetical protein